METILFYILSSLSVIFALLVITRRNPLMSALFLILCFLSTAGIFALLNALFISVLQVLIYAGAIMVLFIFVIMLVHTDSQKLKPRIITFTKIIGAVSVAYLTFVLVIAVLKPPFISAPLAGESYASSFILGKVLLTEYVVPFEILSVLLLGSIVGSIYLAKNKI